MRKLNEKNSTSRRPPAMANYNFLLNIKERNFNNEGVYINKSLSFPKPVTPLKKK